MHKDDKIKDAFSSKFSNFEPSVPSDMWNKIEQGLQGQSVPVSPKKIPLYRYFAAAAGVAAILVICFVLFQPEKDTYQQTSDNTPPIEVNNAADTIITNNAEQEDKKTEQSIPQNPINNQASLAQPIHPYSSFNSNTYQQIASTDGDKRDDAQTLFTNNSPVVIVDDKQDNSQSDNNTKKNVDEKTLKQQLEELEALSQNRQGLLAENLQGKDNKRKGFALSFNGGSGLAPESNDNIIVNNPLSMVVKGESLNTYSDAVVRKETAVDMDHRQPISFGLTVSKDITGKLSVETGLVYTYLSSKIKGEKPEVYQRADNQYFHYLGVPVAVNYTFAEWGKADFYISAGGMIQKDIAGKMKGSSKVQDEFSETEGEFNEKISQDNLQFSVNGAVGASYPIYKNLHVYTTVGGVYYFEANNEYKTIYSDKKLQLDLNIGLKLKF